MTDKPLDNFTDLNTDQTALENGNAFLTALCVWHACQPKIVSVQEAMMAFCCTEGLILAALNGCPYLFIDMHGNFEMDGE